MVALALALWSFPGVLLLVSLPGHLIALALVAAVVRERRWRVIARLVGGMSLSGAALVLAGAPLGVWAMPLGLGLIGAVAVLGYALSFAWLNGWRARRAARAVGPSALHGGAPRPRR
ncbi:MAG: hypothetical protein R3F49_23375 [Planctomycetota bacterium]